MPPTSRLGPLRWCSSAIVCRTVFTAIGWVRRSRDSGQDDASPEPQPKSLRMPSIATASLAVLALACAALALQTIRQRRSRHTFFDGGILLCAALLIAAALPVLSRLP